MIAHDVGRVLKRLRAVETHFARCVRRLALQRGSNLLQERLSRLRVCGAVKDAVVDIKLAQRIGGAKQRCTFA